MDPKKCMRDPVYGIVVNGEIEKICQSVCKPLYSRSFFTATGWMRCGAPLFWLGPRHMNSAPCLCRTQGVDEDAGGAIRQFATKLVQGRPGVLRQAQARDTEKCRFAWACLAWHVLYHLPWHTYALLKRDTSYRLTWNTCTTWHDTHALLNMTHTLLKHDTCVSLNMTHMHYLAYDTYSISLHDTHALHNTYICITLRDTRWLLCIGECKSKALGTLTAIPSSGCTEVSRCSSLAVLSNSLILIEWLVLLKLLNTERHTLGLSQILLIRYVRHAF